MRTGLASCRGAISILNAIPTGIGAAMGITLQTDADVEIADGRPSIQVKLEDREEDARLAEECVKVLFEQLNRQYGKVKVDTKSTIPISRGLKSSSAAANAIILATARAIDADIDDLGIVKLGVEAARRAGVTVTGAFDDATTCYFGGICMTDNSKMEIIKRRPHPNPKLRILLHVPIQKIRKKGLPRETFGKLSKEFEKVENLVRDGDYLRAMTMNGELVALALNISNDIARCALRGGAIAAGISGTGPATAIVVEERRFDEVLDSIPHDNAAVIVAHLNSTPAPEVEPRL